MPPETTVADFWVEEGELDELPAELEVAPEALEVVPVDDEPVDDEPDELEEFDEDVGTVVVVDAAAPVPDDGLAPLAAAFDAAAVVLAGISFATRRPSAIVAPVASPATERDSLRTRVAAVARRSGPC